MNFSKDQKDYLDYIDVIIMNPARQSADKARFSTELVLELNGLVERGVFHLVKKDDIDAQRIYGSRFFDTIRNEGKPNAFEKSRFVVKAFNDSKHGMITHAPTVQRS